MLDSVIPLTVASQALCQWDSPGKNTGVGCHVLLQWDLPDMEEPTSLMSPALISGYFTINVTWEDQGQAHVVKL